MVRNIRNQKHSYSLAYTLENKARHVKVEYEQGDYRIGECKKVKGRSVGELIDRGIEYSKTGRHLAEIQSNGHLTHE